MIRAARDCALMLAMLAMGLALESLLFVQL